MSRHPTARSVALEAIRRVTEGGAYSNIVIPSLLRESSLERRDRAFATDLAYGTLRRLLPIDAAIASSSSRSLGRISPRALGVLRLGVYQLMFAGVAPHAAVAETVGLATARERGFVNAVLRRVASAPVPPPAGDGDDQAIGLRTGLAPWAVAELRAIVGAEVEVAAAAFADRGRLCLRANTCRATPESLRARLVDAGHDVRPATVDPRCFVLERGDPSALPGYAEGWFAVQDQASAFVVRVLGPRPGDRVLDACAAPGGKSVAIACDCAPNGLVIAADVHLGRAARIRRIAQRLGVRVAVLVQDSMSPAVSGSFDRVLVDAPCSGLGTARRRPELLWRPRKEALSRLARRQVALASAAADLVRPGGRLVYAVCTFPLAETDAVADALVRRRPDLEPIETPGPGGKAFRHRLWPHVHGSDGMFVAAFERHVGPSRARD